jgi:hypothetical protein
MGEMNERSPLLADDWSSAPFPAKMELLKAVLFAKENV